MIKVLQVIGSLNYGGIEAVIMNYYRHIDKRKIQFDFITTASGGRFENEIREMGGQIYCLPSKSRHPFRYIKQLTRIIKENNYDIVHSNTNSASAYLDLYPAKKAKCKVRIAHSHNTDCLVKWQHKLLKPLLPSVTTHRLACSKAAAEWLFGKNQDFKIINNGIDFKSFMYNEQVRYAIRENLSLQDTFVIGNVASFQERKNQRFLIEMMPEILREVSSAKLVLIGSGTTEYELKELTQSLGVDENVLFMGNRSDVNILLQGFDVFCFPSLYEGLGVAYVEAMASGLPVIIANGVPLIDFSMNVTQLPLDKSVWLQTIVNIAKSAGGGRLTVSAENWQRTGYDVHVSAKELEEYYMSILQ